MLHEEGEENQAVDHRVPPHHQVTVHPSVHTHTHHPSPHSSFSVSRVTRSFIHHCPALTHSSSSYQSIPVKSPEYQAGSPYSHFSSTPPSVCIPLALIPASVIIALPHSLIVLFHCDLFPSRVPSTVSWTPRTTPTTKERMSSRRLRMSGRSTGSQKRKRRRR